MHKLVIRKIAGELRLEEFQVNNAVDLLFDQECTIPFVARYRKEKTGTLDEVALRDIRDRYLYLTELETNKAKYLKVVEEHCRKKPELNFKDLQLKFQNCSTKQELEDLYLPFKPKRRTRAQIAREKGLEPLADKLFNERQTVDDLAAAALPYVTAAGVEIDPTLKVNTIEEALAGAADILAERLAETAEIRAVVRRVSRETGMLVSVKIDDETAGKTADSKKNQDQERKIAKFQNYFDYRESINSAPAHRLMAVRRGEAEKILKVNLEVDTTKILTEIKGQISAPLKSGNPLRGFLDTVIEDAYKRLLAPSIETELRLQLKAIAEEEAIRVFSKNLENLILLPPIPGKVVMGVDPGLRTGSKLSVVSETGKVLDHAIIYPRHDKSDDQKTVQAKETVAQLLTKHSVTYIAVGNGTGGREINRLIREVLKAKEFENIKRVFVNEAGASVYSTDQVARDEFPDLDPTIRSAISIARRLQDPLAELVKIDPRSIGVGQYQHDVNVTKLKNSLQEVVESCVNRVGVNLNTASISLLGYVSGVGSSLAKNIVAHRDRNGRFGSREDLQRIVGFGPKAFQQAAGFLRVPESSNPLDNSAVHPERYEIVEQIAKDQNKQLGEIIGKRELIDAIPLEKYVTNIVGMPTLKDIAAELIKPGRDPREDGVRLNFSDDINEIEDLKQNMELQGTVTNVTNFGAFVDIGVHQDGLIHISELSNEFVKDPSAVVAVGDIVNVRVLEVDVNRRRISLSRKPLAAAAPARKPQPESSRPREQRPQGNRPQQPQQQQRHGAKPQQRPEQQRANDRGRPPEPRNYQSKHTVDDLLAKFNQRK